MNIFETNDFSKIKVSYYRGTKIYEMRDFYKYPDKVFELIQLNRPEYHKTHLKPSYNGIYFQDMRHEIVNDDVSELQNKLADVCGHRSLNSGFTTNVNRFFDLKFNDYKNNYWWPHVDLGYVCLIFLNKIQYKSTNFYERTSNDDSKINEHFDPWRPKKYYRVTKTINSKFNKMIMFDGKRILHSMCGENKLFFKKKFRMNQSLFFEDGNY